MVDVQFYWDSSFEASQDEATMIFMFIDYIFKLLFKTFRNVNIDIDLHGVNYSSSCLIFTSFPPNR